MQQLPLASPLHHRRASQLGGGGAAQRSSRSAQQRSLQQQQPQQQRRRPRCCRQQAAASGGGQAQPAATITTLQAIPLTEEAFAPFGQVIQPSEDGKPFDASDAQLSLSAGTPRFYIMRLPARGLAFSRITYHACVTQCLGGLSPAAPWYIVVAAPSGSVAQWPRTEQLTAFKVPHGVAVKFKAGTWHAGPLFDQGIEAFDFYNLELSDTNVVDHNTHDYAAQQGVTYQVQPC